MFLGGLIACLFVSIICFSFGYLIWKKKQLSLISGYNEKTYSGDKEKLAHGVGLLLNGIIVIVSTVACVVYIKSISK